MKALALAVFVLLSGVKIASAQTLRAVPVTIQGDDHFPKAIQFFCTVKYPRERCVRDAITLRRVLSRYPVDDLGTWNFVLASSNEWKGLVRSLGGLTGSPAFLVLENRTTVFEEALFSCSGDRCAELIRMFGATERALLEQAVSHELGHILCVDLNENRATQNGRQLLAGRTLACQKNKPQLHAEVRAR